MTIILIVVLLLFLRSRTLQTVFGFIIVTVLAAGFWGVMSAPPASSRQAPIVDSVVTSNAIGVFVSMADLP